MIKELTISNFKLFKDKVKIAFSNVNLLTGINGRGKSTVLQVFLLMKQSPEFDKTTNKIIFNGSHVQLGNINDVKNIRASRGENIEFAFAYEDENIAFDISYQFNASESSLDASIDEIEVKNKKGVGISFIMKGTVMQIKTGEESIVELPFLFNLFPRIEGRNLDLETVENTLNFSRIHYISADRIGPKPYYSKHSLSEFSSVGASGENTINILWSKKDDRVYSNLCEDETLPRVVLPQTEYWISQIFDQAKINVEPIEKTDLLSLKISTNKSTDYFIPTNVGFGYTYVLPIIVSGLIAKKGDIIIVENPEAHLHPYAQSVLSKFLTLVSLNGIQIFIESHSDHILNGFRISVHDKLLSNKSLNVLYFEKNEHSWFDKIDIDNEGGINNWPRRFFDQSSNDLNHLLDL